MKLFNIKSTKHFFVLLFAIGCISISFSQVEIQISYNEKLSLVNIDEGTIFEVKGENVAITLKRYEINDFVFEKPGDYTIEVTKPKHTEEECTHNLLPDTFVVKVSWIRLKFEDKSISFSQPIKKNIDTNGTSLSINVVVETYKNKRFEMQTKAVKSAGIGTGIVAQLDQKHYKLKKGTHTILYHLSGIATENAYIMFDFVAPNGNIQPVAVLKPIEN